MQALTGKVGFVQFELIGVKTWNKMWQQNDVLVATSKMSVVTHISCNGGS